MPRPELIPSRGAIAEPLMLEVTREITHEDILRLGEAPRVGVPMLQRLRASHHRQAQLLASGKAVNEVAAIVGCTPQRLTQLQQDPTFVELVAYYHDQMMSNAMDDASRLAGKIVDIGEAAVDELAVRMEDDAARARMGVNDLRRIAEFAMDRTVAPPKAAPNSTTAPPAITINFGTPLRERRDTDDMPTIEGKVEE